MQSIKPNKIKRSAVLNIISIIIIIVPMPTPSVSSEVSGLFSLSTASSPLKEAIRFFTTSVSVVVDSTSVVFVAAGSVSVSEEIYSAIPKHNSKVKIIPIKAIVALSSAMPASMMDKNNIKRITATIVIKIVIIIFISYFTYKNYSFSYIMTDLVKFGFFCTERFFVRIYS